MLPGTSRSGGQERREVHRRSYHRGHRPRVRRFRRDPCGCRYQPGPARHPGLAMVYATGDGNAGRRIRFGMVGGGRRAFIGAVHRFAARLDDLYELVAGALSANEENARASGLDLGLAPDRTYASFAEMAAREAARPDGIEAVVIVTPNHLHY